jgi:hypothetical protein
VVSCCIYLNNSFFTGALFYKLPPNFYLIYRNRPTFFPNILVPIKTILSTFNQCIIKISKGDSGIKVLIKRVFKINSNLQIIDVLILIKLIYKRSFICVIKRTKTNETICFILQCNIFYCNELCLINTELTSLFCFFNIGVFSLFQTHLFTKNIAL